MGAGMRWGLMGLMGLAACTRSSGAEIVRLPAEIHESSGLVTSHVHPGLLWTHNDSGNAPWLYGVDRSGALKAKVRVSGGTSEDWEAIASDRQGHLWIGDIGNNDNDRTDLAVHRVPEPSLDAKQVKVDRTVRFRYGDQERLGKKPKNFDAEALFWADETLWLATKHRSDTRTTLYRFPALEGDVVLEPVESFDVGGGDLPFGGMVTDAAVHASERQLALLTYHALFVFTRGAEGRWFSSPPRVTRFKGERRGRGQCEALTWGETGLLYTNEGDRVLGALQVPSAK